jgi:hypothetical protein
MQILVCYLRNSLSQYIGPIQTQCLQKFIHKRQQRRCTWLVRCNCPAVLKKLKRAGRSSIAPWMLNVRTERSIGNTKLTKGN